MNDRRKIQIVVIVAYLLFTIIEADYQLRGAGDYYSSLGVPLDVSDKALQSRFRRLTVQYHPDKVPASEHAQVESLFLTLKHAKDTIADPAKRFAYDRFGPDMLQWQSCKTIKDFVIAGVRNITMYYVGTAAALLMTGLLGYLQSGKFWRYLVLASMFTIELYIMTRSRYPAILTSVINPFLSLTTSHPPLLPFQLLALLRKLAITIFIAISQLQPLLRQDMTNAPVGEPAFARLVERSSALATATSQEVNRIVGLEFAQYGLDPNAGVVIRQSLKEWLVQNTVRNDPEVKRAMDASFARRREGVQSLPAAD